MSEQTDKLLERLLERGNAYSCNGSPRGCERERFGGCVYCEDAAWQRFCKEHIQPSKLFRLALNMIEPTEADRQHIVNCVCCYNAYNNYRLHSGQQTEAK